MTLMKVLALEPYYGGSHKAFLDGWIQHSRHEWTVLTLPAYKWKWRMRHSAITFAGQVGERVASGQQWNVVFCSSMLGLAEFLGLAPSAVPGDDHPVAFLQFGRVAHLHGRQIHRA